MKRVIVPAIVILLVFLRPIWSVGNRFDKPMGPVSSGQSGLVRNPRHSSIGQGNLIVTGNVGGGKHFRGIVPYRSTSEFRGIQGSSSIKSFLRRATNPYDLRRQQTTRAYYLPSQTVASLKRDGRSGLKPPSIRLNRGTGEFVPTPPKTYGFTPIVSPQIAVGRYRPISMELEEMEKLISMRARKEPLTSELSQAIQKAPPVKRKQEPEPEDDDWSIDKLLPTSELIEPIKPDEPLRAEEKPKKEIVSVYEKMKQQIQEAFQKQVEQLGEKELIKSEAQKEKLEQAKAGTEQKDTFLKPRPKAEEITPGFHKTFAIIAASKFNEYMASAEELMQQGKYYRAADAYTLANIFKPEDPLPLAGKAHALFAAGEYMSSSYFLANAIMVFPEYTKFKIDVIAMIGDKDKFESRISDIITWQQKSDSGELQFLLAYMHYQTEKYDLAKSAIAAASEKMPDNQAVNILKQTIDAATPSQ